MLRRSTSLRSPLGNAWTRTLASRRFRGVDGVLAGTDGALLRISHNTSTPLPQVSARERVSLSPRPTRAPAAVPRTSSRKPSNYSHS